MLNIAGKPIICHVLESLAANGIRDIIIVVGYRREQMFDYIGDGKQFGVEIKYIAQNKQLGTAHALAQAKGVTDTEFLVLAGDKLIDPDTISRIVNAKPTAMLVKPEHIPGHYGVATIQNSQLVRISEKPAYPESNLINTGIYVFNRDIFNAIGAQLDIPEVLNDLVRRGHKVEAIETTQTWLDVVYPWDILNLNAAILQETTPVRGGTIEAGVSIVGQVSIGEKTIIHSNTYISGPVVIGKGCDIGPNVCIFPATSIADNVVISPFSEIRNSVVGEDVYISSGASIQDSVIDKGCVIGAHFCACSEETEISIESHSHNVKAGAMLGEGCHMGNGIVAHPGVIAGNYCQVRSLKLIRGKIPDKSIVV
jgi:glucose-1-phosphate thymidylyltransferase